MGMLLTRHYAETENKNNNSNSNSSKAKGVTKEVAPKAEAVAEVKEVDTTPTNTVAKIKITVDDIKAMNGTKVRKLAKEYGIENPEELTVGELKAVLCGMVGK